MDTGAKTSALHVENVVELGKGMVRFDIVRNRESSRIKHIETKIKRRGRVRSSNGQYAVRIFVETEIIFAGLRHRIELSLVDRASLIHRLLLGRTALTEVLVDVNGRYRQTTGHRLRKAKKAKKVKKVKRVKTSRPSLDHASAHVPKKKAKKKKAGQPGIRRATFGEIDNSV